MSQIANSELLKNVLEFYVYWHLNSDEKELGITASMWEKEDEYFLEKVIPTDRDFLINLINALNLHRILSILNQYGRLIANELGHIWKKEKTFSSIIKGRVDIPHLLKQMSIMSIDEIERIRIINRTKYYLLPQNIFVVCVLKTLSIQLSNFLKALREESIKKLQFDITISSLYKNMLSTLLNTNYLLAEDKLDQIAKYIEQFLDRVSIFEKCKSYCSDNISSLWFPYRKFFETYIKYREVENNFNFVFETEDDIESRLFELFVLKQVVLFLGPEGLQRGNFRSEGKPIYMRFCSDKKLMVEIFFQSTGDLKERNFYKKEEGKDSPLKMIPDIVIKLTKHGGSRCQYIFVDAKFKTKYTPADLYQGVAYLEHFNKRGSQFVLIYNKEGLENSDQKKCEQIEVIKHRYYPTELLIKTNFSLREESYNQLILSKISKILV